MSSPWADRAYQALEEFVVNRKSDFMAVDVREFAERNGLPPAATSAAWSPVLQRGRRAGLIDDVGYGPSPDPTARKRLTLIWRAI